MSKAQAKQERLGAAVMSVGSVLIAGIGFLTRPAPGEFVEAGPDWYISFTVILHAAILVLLLVSLVRLQKMTAEIPALRTPFLVMILVGLAAAAYVVGRDLGLV